VSVLEFEEILEAKRRHGWVILFADEEKNPSISGKWKSYTTQTEEELQELLDRVGDRASCWGPVCGLGELFSFDFDWPFIYGLWHRHFGERAQTLTYETPNTGARPFFLTKEKTKGDPFETSLHTEFKQNHFVACGGHANNINGELRPYIKAIDQPIRRDDRILQNSTKFLHELLEGRYSWLRYKCIKEKMGAKRIVLNHKQALAINSFMLIEGCEDWEIHNFRRACYDVDEAGKHRLEYDRGTTQTQIDSGRKYIKGGGKPFPCRPTETNEGLPAVFDFNPQKCEGCPRRTERTGVRSPGSFFETRSDGKLGRFIPKRLADYITKDRRFMAFSEKSRIWYYKPELGIWGPDGIELIQELVTETLGSLSKGAHTTETLIYIRHTHYFDRSILGGPAHVIVMENGAFNLETLELGPFDPDLYATTRIPVTYNPEATCPTVDKFLSEVVRLKHVEPLVELAGYCLLKAFPVARIVILEGEGDNGKSTFLNFLTAFLGSENVSSVTLQKLGEEGFRSAELFGKLANISADIPSKPLKDAGQLKMLTGADMITAERKYRDPFQYKNHAKPIFSANKIPASWDDTIAFHRRMVVIPFPNSFPREDPKTDLWILEKLTTPEEFSGFFNLAVKGLQVFLEQKGFTNEPPAAVRRLEYIKKSDPIQYFSLQYVEKDTELWITKAQLYDHYVTLCTELNVIPKANNVFSREVRRFLPYVYEGLSPKRRGSESREKIWRGIRVKTELFSDTDDADDTDKSSLLTSYGKNDSTLVSKIEENTVSSVSSASHSEEDSPEALERRSLIIEEAVSILEELGHETMQKTLFDKLAFRDFPWEEAGPILRADTQFRFMGMMVALKARAEGA